MFDIWRLRITDEVVSRILSCDASELEGLCKSRVLNRSAKPGPDTFVGRPTCSFYDVVFASAYLDVGTSGELDESIAATIAVSIESIFEDFDLAGIALDSEASTFPMELKCISHSMTGLSEATRRRIESSVKRSWRNAYNIVCEILHSSSLGYY